MTDDGLMRELTSEELSLVGGGGGPTPIGSALAKSVDAVVKDIRGFLGGLLSSSPATPTPDPTPFFGG